ncbi:hypothetical protein PsorP6_006092 [Peronosclerospora sorghi]|uniref:Uncharacterized protein n=1 Tax=Peronosclerospora sorghi TaxID=230839 RepID=A0ACC0W4A5_9STRA|nr:hypothetical protein PsorP6_006092 [Peronosclerospora sorghi]
MIDRRSDPAGNEFSGNRCNAATSEYDMYSDSRMKEAHVGSLISAIALQGFIEQKQHPQAVKDIETCIANHVDLPLKCFLCIRIPGPLIALFHEHLAAGKIIAERSFRVHHFTHPSILRNSLESSSISLSSCFLDKHELRRRSASRWKLCSLSTVTRALFRANRTIDCR